MDIVKNSDNLSGLWQIRWCGPHAPRPEAPPGFSLADRGGCRTTRSWSWCEPLACGSSPRNRAPSRTCALSCRFPQCVGSYRCAIPIEDLARLGWLAIPLSRVPRPPTLLRRRRLVSLAGLPRAEFRPIY